MSVVTDFMGHDYRDRYEFHPQDSDLWLSLFRMSDSEPLASLLQYIRNTGAILEPSDKYGYVIRPVIGVQGWQSMEEYEWERKLLVPHTTKLLEMLRRLRDESPN